MKKFKVKAIINGKEVANKIKAASFQDVVNQYQRFELVSVERVEEYGMSKRKDGVFSLLRHIIGNQKKIIKEQEKQTKILQAIESSKEQSKRDWGQSFKRDSRTINNIKNPY